jgi:GTP cyclohydrolase IB
MKDVQSEPDGRRIGLLKVGVKGLVYPITVLDREKGVQHTMGTVNMFADLPHDFKGTHMSRFIEVFNEHREDLSMKRFLIMLAEIRESLDADDAYSDLSFPYFMRKRAPVSGQESIMRYDAAYSGRVSAAGSEFLVRVSAPVQTVCPCSKAISERGAHNQRGLVTATVRLGPFFWIEEIIEMIEASASSGVYALLKREDEKWITEKAYDEPRFVEDVVREVYARLEARGGFPWFSVEAENFESIHNHSAYAYAEYPAPGRRPEP